MFIDILDHVSLGQVWLIQTIGNTGKAIVRTVADNIQYRINLLDTNW